jgi:hypothetical protein
MLHYFAGDAPTTTLIPSGLRARALKLRKGDPAYKPIFLICPPMFHSETAIRHLLLRIGRTRFPADIAFAFGSGFRD